MTTEGSHGPNRQSVQGCRPRGVPAVAHWCRLRQRRRWARDVRVSVAGGHLVPHRFVADRSADRQRILVDVGSRVARRVGADRIRSQTERLGRRPATGRARDGDGDRRQRGPLGSESERRRVHGRHAQRRDLSHRPLIGQDDRDRRTCSWRFPDRRVGRDLARQCRIRADGHTGRPGDAQDGPVQNQHDRRPGSRGGRRRSRQPLGRQQPRRDGCRGRSDNADRDQDDPAHGARRVWCSRQGGDRRNRAFGSASPGPARSSASTPLPQPKPPGSDSRRCLTPTCPTGWRRQMRLSRNRWWRSAIGST